MVFDFFKHERYRVLFIGCIVILAIFVLRYIGTNGLFASADNRAVYAITPADPLEVASGLIDELEGKIRQLTEFVDEAERAFMRTDRIDPSFNTLRGNIERLLVEIQHLKDRIWNVVMTPGSIRPFPQGMGRVASRYYSIVNPFNSTLFHRATTISSRLLTFFMTRTATHILPPRPPMPSPTPVRPGRFARLATFFSLSALGVLNVVSFAGDAYLMHAEIRNVSDEKRQAYDNVVATCRTARRDIFRVLQTIVERVQTYVVLGYDVSSEDQRSIDGIVNNLAQNCRQCLSNIDAFNLLPPREMSATMAIFNCSAHQAELEEIISSD